MEHIPRETETLSKIEHWPDKLRGNEHAQEESGHSPEDSGYDPCFYNAVKIGAFRFCRYRNGSEGAAPRIVDNEPQCYRRNHIGVEDITCIVPLGGKYDGHKGNKAQRNQFR